MITVNADNDAPSASRAGPRRVDEDDSATLAASHSSDTEDEPLTYSWTQTAGPVVVLSDGSAAQPTFTAPNELVNTDLTFQVTVEDPGGQTSIDTVTITVNADDDAPAASAGPDQTVNEEDVVTLDATGSGDPEGEALTYTWVQTSGPAVTLSDNGASQPTFTAPNELVNTDLTFQVTVQDPGGQTSIDTVTITVNADDDAPAASAGPDQTVNEEDVVTLDATGSSDPEGDALTYTWVQTSGPAVVLSDNGASPSINLVRRQLKMFVACDRKHDHLCPLFIAGHWPSGFQRRLGSGNEYHLIKFGQVVAIFRQQQVSKMNGIKCTTIECHAFAACFHRRI